jgi:metallophosphoesterase (TIGR00282 family)
LSQLLPELRGELQIDLVTANAENTAGGFGLTPKTANALLQAGVDVMTSGNHIWQQREIWPRLESDDRLLRPHNYPPSVPGKGVCLVEVGDVTVGVLNLEGRVGMADLRCPFRVAQAEVAKLRKVTPLVVVDMHAESVEEKEALALHLDGTVSAVVGTHTHVQTADERILPGGTAYLTDLGMTGPRGSVIGMKADVVLRRTLSQMPLKMEVDEGPADICGALLTVDRVTGKANAIELVHERSEL